MTWLMNAGSLSWLFLISRLELAHELAHDTNLSELVVLSSAIWSMAWPMRPPWNLTPGAMSWSMAWLTSWWGRDGHYLLKSGLMCGSGGDVGLVAIYTGGCAAVERSGRGRSARVYGSTAVFERAAVFGGTVYGRTVFGYARCTFATLRSAQK